MRGKPVQSRVHHRIIPGSLPVSGPSSCGASPPGLCSSVRLDTCGSPSAMTFDGDGMGAGTGTGGLGVCGDVDDGIGSDVAVHEPHIILTLLCQTTGQYHRGTGYALDLPKASTVHASPRTRSHSFASDGTFSVKMSLSILTSPSLTSCHWTTLSCSHRPWRHCPAPRQWCQNRQCSP